MPMHTRRTLLPHWQVGAILALTSSIAHASGPTCTPQWITTPGEPGMDARVRALIVHDDGSGPALYAGGDFDSAGGVSASGIARWVNGLWQKVGNGDELFAVNSLAIFDDGTEPDLYAAAFDLMRWDGAQWSEVPGQPSSVHSAIGVHDSGDGPELIVSGGFFILTKDGWTEYIARWNGAAWHAMGDGLISVAHDYQLFVDGSGEKLFAAGGFGFFDGTTFEGGFGQWDGSNWSAVSGSTNGSGNALAVFDDGSGPALYVGGNFSRAGSQQISRLARWDGTQWGDVGGGVNNLGVSALAVFDDGSGPALYVGGEFTQAGGIAASNIAKWDGASWSALGGGTNGPVRALHVVEHDGVAMLAVAGDFTEVDGQPAGRIALFGCVPDNPADIDGSGAVDIFDLTALLQAWGDCDPPCPPSCPADITNADGTGTDCTVNVFDLVLLLQNWG